MEGLGFRVQGLNLRFRVKVKRLRAQGLGFGVEG